MYLITASSNSSIQTFTYSPPFQQRIEVVHEGVAAVGGERDGLVAMERLGAADIVVEDPVLLVPG